MTPTSDLPDDEIASRWLQQRSLERFVIDGRMREMLEVVGTRRRWKAGDVLARYGSRMTCVGICLSGQYKVLLNSVDGHSHFIRRIAAGELFGVPSVLSEMPFPTDLICEEAGETLEVPHQALIHALRTEPELALGVIKSLATRVAEMFDLMEAALLPTLRARVYQRLLRLAQLNGQLNEAGQTVLPLSQSEIAQSVNASRPKVHQELKRMEREGLLRLGYRQITLLKLASTYR